MILAIDGTSGSGKGTLSKTLAKKYNLSYLDTGKLYRIIAFNLLKNKIDHSLFKDQALKISKDMSYKNLAQISYGYLIDDKVSELSSLVASFPEVRENLTDFQRDFAHNYPSNKAGSILDGRDIGSVILPNADIKIFLDASPEIRAKRRTDELIEKGKSVNFRNILKSINERDLRDKTRKTAPLLRPENSLYIDTSNKNLDEVARVAYKKIDSFIEKRKKID